jgi:hypothetical protein
VRGVRGRATKPASGGSSSSSSSKHGDSTAACLAGNTLELTGLLRLTSNMRIIPAAA